MRINRDWSAVPTAHAECREKLYREKERWRGGVVDLRPTSRRRKGTYTEVDVSSPHIHKSGKYGYDIETVRNTYDEEGNLIIRKAIKKEEKIHVDLTTDIASPKKRRQ